MNDSTPFLANSNMKLLVETRPYFQVGSNAKCVVVVEIGSTSSRLVVSCSGLLEGWRDKYLHEHWLW